MHEKKNISNKTKSEMTAPFLTRRPSMPRRKRIILCLSSIFVVLFLYLLFLGWTMIQMPGKSYQGELPAADEPLKQLAEELRKDVTKLSGEIGERNVTKRPEALDQAAKWIQSEFAATGLTLGHQIYTVDGHACRNLEVEIPGKTKPAEIVIIGAHYDSMIGTPGANDNGTGIAATLALLRRFAHHPLNKTLRFVAFVNEEPPYFQTDRMGSAMYAKRCHEQKEKITAMISLETIGCYSDAPDSQHYPRPLGLLYPSVGNFIGFVGNKSSAELVRHALGTFRQEEKFPSEGAALPDLFPGVGFSDHWAFNQQGYPALMVTDTAMYRYPHYHEAEDTTDKIDFDRTARVVRGLEKVVEELGK
jgi:Zn-dependent M28 family amino/carboxypeptidase